VLRGRRLGEERGQILPLLAGGMTVVLLAISGLVIDVGHAYAVKQKLQAVADASALAAAGSLPTVSSAGATAVSYGPAGKNPVSDATVAQTTSAWCLTSITYCYGGAPGSAVTSSGGQANGVVVSEQATVPTSFLKLVGVNSLSVSAKAVACGMCGTQPLNIVLVVDRTGSMAPNIADLKAGLATFAGSLDPNLDWVSLLVLPPATGGNACVAAPQNTSYPLNAGDSYPVGSDAAYAVVHWSHDYLTASGSLNPSSQLVQQVNCISAAGSTSYKQALIAAQAELANPPAGRASYQKVIVFESDGAANTAPDSYFDSTSGKRVALNDGTDTIYKPTSAHTDDVNRPCGSAVDYASTLKASGVQILTVGYQANDDCYQAPHITGKRGSTTLGVGYRQVPEGLAALTALAQIASPADAFTASNASTMSSAFAGIANKIQGAQLVPDSEAPGS
jgi:Flp pilus assembly protein TadG